MTGSRMGWVLAVALACACGSDDAGDAADMGGAGNGSAGAGNMGPGSSGSGSAGGAEVPEPSFVECSALDASFTGQVLGAWSGTLTLEQTLLGEDKQAERVADVFLDVYGAPRESIAAAGYLGDGWRAYSSDFSGGELDLSALFAGGGDGTVFAFNTNEADGPANELTIEDSCFEFSDRLFAWRYQLGYHIADVVDRELYGYEEPDAPLVTLRAEEVYAVSGERLHVRAHAEGSTPDRQPVSITMTGELQRITR